MYGSTWFAHVWFYMVNTLILFGFKRGPNVLNLIENLSSFQCIVILSQSFLQTCEVYISNVVHEISTNTFYMHRKVSLNHCLDICKSQKHHTDKPKKMVWSWSTDMWQFFSLIIHKKCDLLYHILKNHKIFINFSIFCGFGI